MKKVKLNIIRYIAYTHVAEVSDEEYEDLMTDPLGKTEMKVLNEASDTLDEKLKNNNFFAHHMNADYMLENEDGEVFEPFCDGFLEEIIDDVEMWRKKELKV